jgi:hypothetical protein
MFDIASSEDFYAALVSDFDDLMTEPHSARRALHCAMTAYHLHEWVWGDWLKHDEQVKAALGIRDKDSYVEWLHASCIWFGFVQSLANGAKHFDRNRGFDSYRVAALPFALDQPNAGLDMGAWDGPIRAMLEAHCRSALMAKATLSLIAVKPRANRVGSPRPMLLKSSSGFGGTFSADTGPVTICQSVAITSIDFLGDHLIEHSFSP